MKKVLIALASVLAITAGCTKEEFRSVLFGESVQECPVKTVKAAIESRDTKASLDFDTQQMFWAKGDTIAVFGRIISEKLPAVDNQNRAKYALDPEYAGQPEGEFEYADGTLDLSNVYYAVYPYSATTDNSVVSTTGKDKITEDIIKVEFPSKEKFDNQVRCAEGANIMVAKFSQADTTDAPKFYFRNLCAYIEFYAEGPAEDKLQSAIIKTKDGSPINGIATCTFGENDAISLEFDGDGTDAVVVTFYDAETGVEGIDFGSEPIDIALPPVINDGFTITLVSVNGLETTVSSDVVLGRNTLTVFEEPIVLDVTGGMVASVAGVEYPSFISALKAANEAGEDCTITLLRDCYTTGVAEVSNANAVITLDLNGKTLKSVDVNRINVLQESKGFVIEDNSVEQTGTIKQENAGGDAVLSYGHLEINSGTIIGGLAAVYVYNGDLIINGGTFKGDATSTGVITVNSSSNTEFVVDSVAFRGGLVEASSRGTYLKGGCRNITFYDGFVVNAGKVPVYNTDCGITINGGEFNSVSTNVVYSKTDGGCVEIHGGYYSTGGSVAVVYTDSKPGLIIADGGFYSRNVPVTSVKDGYQCEGCEVTYNEKKYSYRVVQQASQQALLTIEGEEGQIYSDGTKALQAAVAAGKNCEVKLLSSFTMNDVMSVNSSLTSTIIIDLNGYTLSTNGKTRRINVDGGHLILRSTGENASSGTLACLPYNSYNIEQKGGTITIESGRYIGADGCTYENIHSEGQSQKMIIKGGYFYCDYFRAIWFQGTEAGGGSELTIEGGEFISGRKGKVVADTLLNESIYITSNSKALLTGGHASAVCSYGNSDVTLNGFKADTVMKVNTGAMTIMGGSFDNNVTLDAHSAASVIDVTAGTFADTLRTMGEGAVNISGGTYNGTISVEATGNTNLNGGTFNHIDGAPAVVAVSGTANINEVSLSASCALGTVRAGCGTVNINEGARIAAKGEGNRALYIGNNTNADLKGSVMKVSGGDISSEDRTIHIYSGSLNIEGGKFSTTSDTQPILYCNGTKGRNTLSITDGYFSGVNMISNGGSGTDILGSVFGGHYTNTFDASIVNESMEITDTAPVVEGGITYTYSIKERTDVPDVIKVNGKGFKSLEAAIAAAKSSEVDAEIQLIQDIELPGINNDFTNANGKAITIDINGYVFSSNSRNAILTEGVLNIKDGSQGHTGKLVAARNRFIFVKTKGTVNITDCLLETSATNRYTNTDSSVVVVHGTSSNKKGAVNITNCTFKTTGDNGCSFIGNTYGTVTIENSALINKAGADKDKGYYCIKTTSGAITSITNSKLYSVGSPVLIQGSANNATFSITNSYFYGGGGQAISSTSGQSYDKCLTVTSGWFNSDIRSKLANWKVADGSEWKKLDTKVKVTIDGDDCEFGYAVQVK